MTYVPGDTFEETLQDIAILQGSLQVWVPTRIHKKFQKHLKGQGHVTVNRPVISMVYIVAHTWPLCSTQMVDGVNPQ